MEKFSTLTSPAAPLPEADVDTDIIFPARFLLLLRARGPEETAHHARQAARWCAVQGAAVRFADRYGADGFGGFLLAAALDLASAERRAHAIARDYFRNLPRDAGAEMAGRAQPGGEVAEPKPAQLPAT